jgi:hypothetical protein
MNWEVKQNAVQEDLVLLVIKEKQKRQPSNIIMN